ncbi:MAG: response regulator, partial [Calditrichaeota bacterium]|nr:response regulator [Calditrichota bacterium]
MEARILVVDDEPDVEFLIRKKFRKKIREQELDFSFAQNGLEALEQLAQVDGIDLVLTDINMPRMDGLTLIQKIGEFRYNVKAVVVSAYDDMDNIRKAMNFGAFDFITKPIDFQDFENTVYKTLLKKKQEENVELEETLRELRETQQQLVLQEKMASLGNLVAGIAHEINNPIGVINSASDVVKRCIEKIEAALAQRQEGNAIEKPILLLKDNNRLILNAGTRIATLVKSLKNFARLDEEEYQEADLREGIESTLTLVEQQVCGRIAIEKRLSELPRVYCSPGQINQVFMSILLNAIQAIDGPGSIEIGAFAKDNRVYIEFRDS